MAVDPTTAVPVVSVIIPAYNAAATLDEQLDALAAQNADFAWEVIVADNGSTDGTAALVRERQRREPNLRLLDASARRGPSAARNLGAGAARADLLAFCDADDVVDVDWLATFVRALDVVSFVGGRVDYERLRPRAGTAVSWVDPGPFFISNPVLGEFLGLASCNLAIRRELFIELAGFDERLHVGEDVDFSWRAQLAGHPLTVCPALCHYRLRGTLASIARQAWTWGTCTPTLARRYAHVRSAIDALAPAIAAIAAADAAIAAAQAKSGERDVQQTDTAAPARRSELRRVARGAWRRLVEGRLRTIPADLAMQLGLYLGARFARADESLPQIEPPAELAAILTRTARKRWNELGATAAA